MMTCLEYYSSSSQGFYLQRLWILPSIREGSTPSRRLSLPSCFRFSSWTWHSSPDSGFTLEYAGSYCGYGKYSARGDFSTALKHL